MPKAACRFTIHKDFYEDPPVWDVLQREIKREAVQALSKLGFLDHSTMQMRVKPPSELDDRFFTPDRYVVVFEAEVYA